MSLPLADAERLLSQHGLAAVLAGTFLEGEAVLLAAGVLAARGLLPTLGVWSAAALGGWVGHVTWFSLARLTGSRSVLAPLLRWPPFAARLARANVVTQRHPTAAMVILQYLYGVRLVGAFALGLTTISWSRFLVTEAFNCLVWAAIFTATGYAAGGIATQIFVPWVRWSWIAISLGLAWLVIHRLSRRVLSEPDQPSPS